MWRRGVIPPARMDTHYRYNPLSGLTGYLATCLSFSEPFGKLPDQ